MTILQIAAFTILAIIIGQLHRGRQTMILAVGTIGIFWLQPFEPFTSLKFWFPIATIGITVCAWALTSPPESRNWKSNWRAASILTAVILLVVFSSYLRINQILSIPHPSILIAAFAVIGLVAITSLLAKWDKAHAFWRIILFMGIVSALVFIKAPPLFQFVLGIIKHAQITNSTIGSIPLTWLGFSYLAFRLMHTIRDSQTGRLPPVALGEYINYVIFFPAFTAGPIDRLERFVPVLREPLPLANPDWLEAGIRLMVGLFKKFVIADLLAVISLSDVLVFNVKSRGWLWIFLYAYAIRIYFDFSGYTDIAIGMGRLMGIRLPENFASPYLQTNLTRFWNSWHITLTQWFRSYFFNPLTRMIRSAQHPLPDWLMILITQVSTMMLIGLWHGITLGFITWGLWHGIGLFLQNRWSAFTRNRLPPWSVNVRYQWAVNTIGIFLTFNYVTLGWLFFNLSTPAIAWQALQKLFGIA